jgi:hypothetical protein
MRLKKDLDITKIKPKNISKKTPEEAQKIKSVNDALWKRLGYETVITRLMDFGVYDNLDTILNLDTKESLRLIALKNASSIL